jgi:hypothetical protein
MNFLDALRLAGQRKDRRDYPAERDARIRNEIIFPIFSPKFALAFSPGTKVFTIGSCFARNIEEALRLLGARLPTADFAAPKSEWPWRPNGLLNEYNPATINQRILFALENKPFPVETIVPCGKRFADLLLPADVELKRAIERRGEIARVYNHLATSEVLIITLGLIETWFDQETKLYLNRMPPYGFASKNPNRFIFKRLDVYDCMPLLESACDALQQTGAKIIFSVSPVPLQTSLSGDDCVTANEYSKSVLRVCPHRLAKRLNVDYFPSYEIVRSGGLRADPRS